MNQDADLVVEQLEHMRLRRQRSALSSTSYEHTPKIKMSVSDWYIDEFGNKARTVKAYDKLK